MAEPAVINVSAKQVRFITQTSGDYLEVAQFNIGPKEAGNLATLINTPDCDLKIEISQVV